MNISYLTWLWCEDQQMNLESLELKAAVEKRKTKTNPFHHCVYIITLSLYWKEDPFMHFDSKLSKTLFLRWLVLKFFFPTGFNFFKNMNAGSFVLFYISLETRGLENSSLCFCNSLPSALASFWGMTFWNSLISGFDTGFI